MSTPGKIRKLDEVVVNRIAAGEIIHRPANALKELIENSLDAKSTNIQISAKEGGLKLLQIKDNGTGIRKEDLNIVCERFTTSKLQSFDDLKSIATFGFRGEALASISHVAQLTIISKTVNDKCAYKASYIDGKLKEIPSPCAGNQGTTIIVENLFYNVTTRRKVLISFAEEFIRIAEVVIKYAIHNPSVGFSLKKHNETINQFRTSHSSTKIENVRLLYGNNVAKELLEIDLEDKTYKFRMNALVTNTNFSSKRLTFLLFINHRLVESTSIKKTIVDLYNVYLPKRNHPWCYISLEIEPQNIDVNVHPTKHEVRFLHEDAIISKIRNSLNENLILNNALQGKVTKVDIIKEVLPKVNRIHPKDLVRTNSADQKLDKFNFTCEIISKNDMNCDKTDKKYVDKVNNDRPINVVDRNLNSTSMTMEIKHNIFEDVNTKMETSNINNLTHNGINQSETCKNLNFDLEENSATTSKTEKTDLDTRKSEDKNKNGCGERKSCIYFKSYSINKVQIEIKLLSILSLRKDVEDTFHKDLRNILAHLIFVGCIDEVSALIQSGVSLYICHTKNLVEELFYEIMLYDFANYGVIKFSEPLLIKDLALLGLECEEAGWSEEVGDKEQIATHVQELLLEKADMLKQYFSIYINKKGYLKSLPVLLENYSPSQACIPMYLLRLSTEVNWSKEKQCFHDICRETAKFYSQIDTTEKTWKHVTEHILYRAIKDSLLPPKHFLCDSTILEIANLPNLYKVFERC